MALPESTDQSVVETFYYISRLLTRGRFRHPQIKVNRDVDDGIQTAIRRGRKTYRKCTIARLQK